MEISIFGKTLVRRYDHYIYKLQYGGFKPYDEGRLEHFELDCHNLGRVEAPGYIIKLYAEQPKFVYGLGFCDNDNNVVGRAFMLTKGGQNHHYKICNIDAYLFGVEVLVNHRGHRYSADMVTRIVEEFHRRGIDEYYLAVLKDNTPAKKVYERLGFEVVGERSFHRIPKLSLNIPYYTL